MKKLMFLTAFMLMYLCSYSQKLYVRNDSPYTITVTASEGDDPNCADATGSIASLAPSTVGWISTADDDYDWTSVRAQDVPNGMVGPQYFVVSNADGCPVGIDCVTEVSIGLTASWNGCYEVTIDD